MTKTFHLGRGLGSLIPQKQTVKEESGFTISPIADEEKITFLSPDEIEANPMQPRQNFEYHELEDLINSIREHGILQPLIITKKTDGHYQLIAGERRLRAAKILELKRIPCIIRKASELEKLELSLIENIQRQDLNPMEKARAYQKLMDEFALTQEEVAKKVGKERPTVANTLRLLTLPEEIRQSLEENKISEGHAKIILSLVNPIDQIKLFRRILIGGLTVKEADGEIKGTRKKRVDLAQDPYLKEKQDQLINFLGTKVEVNRNKYGGKIVITFYTKEDLDGVMEKIIH